MTKKVFFLIVTIFFIPAIAKSQTDITNLLKAKAPTCEDIAYNSTLLIMKYYENQNLDSAKIILNYWRDMCGLSEPIIRTQILFSIEDNTFDESLYDIRIIDYVFSYIDRIETSQPELLYYNNKFYFGFVPIGRIYDNFTKELAFKLIDKQPYNSLKLFYCRFYANQIIYPIKEIRDNPIYNETKIKQLYLNEVNKYLDLPDYNVNLYAGVWMPTGNAKLLGNHPFVGFQTGVRFKKMTYNLNMGIKFLNSENEYQFQIDGIIDTSTYFFGGYLGADIERAIIKTERYQFDLLSGIAYDGFNVINSDTNDDNPDNDISRSLNSLNINFGLGYKHYFNRNGYIGVQGRYNFVNYNNSGGTDLSGNTITITFLFGGFSNPTEYQNLNALRYYD